MDKIKGFMSGYRTYAIVAIGLLCVAAETLLGIDIPGFDTGGNWLEYVMGLLGLGTVRAGVAAAAKP